MKNIRSSILTILAILVAAVPSFAKDQNISTINHARALYASGKLTESIKVYEKIPKSSDFWVEAVEEKAWAYVRLNQFDKALSELRSILNPLFLPLVGPEAIMLATFIELKTCSYKDVFEKIKLYKREMLPRVDALEAIVAGKSTALSALQAKMQKGNVSGADLGKDITKLPRFYYRDSQALTNPSRAVILAKKDLEDISKNLKKMKIIEVEVIQRSFAFDEKVSKEKLAFNNVDSSNKMIFPDEKDNEEVWLDEIGSYEVKTQTCATSGVKK